MPFRAAVAARSRTRTLTYVAGGTGLVFATAYYIYNPSKAIFPPPPPGGRPPPPWTPPSRLDMLASLRASVPVTSLQSQADLKGAEEFDLLIIGGGATGSGVAVDAASRGLKVALVDRGDFSSGPHRRPVFSP
jgi:glycerol-3-phosphate dehydrogenase